MIIESIFFLSIYFIFRVTYLELGERLLFVMFFPSLLPSSEFVAVVLKCSMGLLLFHFFSFAHIIFLSFVSPFSFFLVSVEVLNLTTNSQ